MIASDESDREGSRTDYFYRIPTLLQLRMQKSGIAGHAPLTIRFKVGNQ